MGKYTRRLFTLVLGAAIALAPIASARATDDESVPAEIASINAAAGVAAWLNAYRPAIGLSSLSTSACPALGTDAFYTSIVDAQSGVLAHDPQAPGDLHVCGAHMGGQNVGYATAGPQCSAWPDAVGFMIRAFFEDPGHAANMNNPAWRNLGIGAWCTSDGRLFLTLNFNG